MSIIQERRLKLEGFLKKRNERFSNEELVEMGQLYIDEMMKHGEKFFPLAQKDWDKEEEEY